MLLTLSSLMALRVVITTTSAIMAALDFRHTNDDILPVALGCTESCQNDNFRHNQRRKCHLLSSNCPPSVVAIELTLLFLLSVLLPGPSSSPPSRSHPPASRSRKRRARTHFSASALAELEAAFRRSAYPDVEERERLSVLIQQPEARVHTWFQNKRSRTRRHGRNQGARSTASSSEGNSRSHISDEDIEEMRLIDMTMTSDDESSDSHRPKLPSAAPVMPLSPLMTEVPSTSSWLPGSAFSTPFQTPYSALFMTSLASRQLFPSSPLLLPMPSLLPTPYLTPPVLAIMAAQERPLEPLTPSRRPGQLFRPVDFTTLDSSGQEDALDLSVSPTSALTGSSSHTSGYNSDRDTNSPAIDVCSWERLMSSRTFPDTRYIDIDKVLRRLNGQWWALSFLGMDVCSLWLLWFPYTTEQE